jgi:hypothetical protein
MFLWMDLIRIPLTERLRALVADRYVIASYHLHMYASMQVCIYVCYIYIHIYTYIYIYIQYIHLWTCQNAPVNGPNCIALTERLRKHLAGRYVTPWYVCVCVYAPMYIRTCAPLHSHTYTFTSMYPYTQIHTCTRTHTYIHIHTFMSILPT